MQTLGILLSCQSMPHAAVPGFCFCPYAVLTPVSVTCMSTVDITVSFHLSGGPNLRRCAKPLHIFTVRFFKKNTPDRIDCGKAVLNARKGKLNKNTFVFKSDCGMTVLNERKSVKNRFGPKIEFIEKNTRVLKTECGMAAMNGMKSMKNMFGWMNDEKNIGRDEEHALQSGLKQDLVEKKKKLSLPLQCLGDELL